MKILSIISLTIFILISAQLNAQDLPEITWDEMAKVIYDPRFDEETQSVVTTPKYIDRLEELNQKEVQIRGYIIPMDTEGKEYVLSAFPNSSCFFCGNATKESVIELGLKEVENRFKLDQVATFSGVLVLNKGAFGLNYKLESAEISK